MFFRSVPDVLRFQQDEGEWYENMLFYYKRVKKISRLDPKGTLTWIEGNRLHFHYFSCLVLCFPSHWPSHVSGWGAKAMGSPIRFLGSMTKGEVKEAMSTGVTMSPQVHSAPRFHSTGVYWWPSASHLTTQSPLCLLSKTEFITTMERWLLRQWISAIQHTNKIPSYYETSGTSVSIRNDKIPLSIVGNIISVQIKKKYRLKCVLKLRRNASI